MKLKDRGIKNDAIADILNKFVCEENTPETHKKIADEIKCALEEKEVDYTTVNTYTSPEIIEKGFISIEIDGESYPLQEIDIIDNDNCKYFIERYELGRFGKEDVIKFFQYFIDTEDVWNMHEKHEFGLESIYYAKIAQELIAAGWCMLGEKRTVGHMMWGWPLMNSRYSIKSGYPGTQKYVNKRNEMTDEEFEVYLEGLL